MKKLIGIIVSAFFLFGLTACSQSPKEKIVGEWELIDDSSELNYWHITENEIVVKSEYGETLSTQEYEMTEIEASEDKDFKLNFNGVSENESEVLAKIFDISIEGHFEDENTINASTSMAGESIGQFELVRIKKGKVTSSGSKTENDLANEKDGGDSSNSKTEINLSGKKGKLYSMGDMNYSVPKSWNEKQNDENTKYYYPENAMLMVAYTNSNETLSNDKVRANFMEGYTSGFDSFNIISESETTVAGVTAYEYKIDNVMSDQNFKNSIVVFNYYDDGIIAFHMATLMDSTQDYSNDFESILDSIEFTRE